MTYQIFEAETYCGDFVSGERAKERTVHTLDMTPLLYFKGVW